MGQKRLKNVGYALKDFMEKLLALKLFLLNKQAKNTKIQK
jgi:hypothetical protein